MRDNFVSFNLNELNIVAINLSDLMSSSSVFDNEIVFVSSNDPPPPLLLILLLVLLVSRLILKLKNLLLKLID